MTLLDSESGRKALEAAQKSGGEYLLRLAESEDILAQPNLYRDALAAALPFLAEAFAEAVEMENRLARQANASTNEYWRGDLDGWDRAVDFLRTLR